MILHHIKKQLGLILVLTPLALAVQAQTTMTQPKFTIIPLSTTTFALAANEIGTIQYQVTNQTARAHTLTSVPISGITMTNDGSTRACAVPSFTLAAGASCTLTLSIDPSSWTSLNTTVKICQTNSGTSTPDPFACSQTSIANSLNITVLPPITQAVLTIKPNSLALGSSTTFAANSRSSLCNTSSVTAYGVTPSLTAALAQLDIRSAVESSALADTAPASILPAGSGKGLLAQLFDTAAATQLAMDPLALGTTGGLSTEAAFSVDIPPKSCVAVEYDTNAMSLAYGTVATGSMTFSGTNAPATSPITVVVAGVIGNDIALDRTPIILSLLRRNASFDVVNISDSPVSNIQPVLANTRLSGNVEMTPDAKCALLPAHERCTIRVKGTSIRPIVLATFPVVGETAQGTVALAIGELEIRARLPALGEHLFGGIYAAPRTLLGGKPLLVTPLAFSQRPFWGLTGQSIVSAESLGDGATNTAAIYAKYKTQKIPPFVGLYAAASYCAIYQGDVDGQACVSGRPCFTGFYLPAIFQLDRVARSVKNNPGILPYSLDSRLWSSTEVSFPLISPALSLLYAYGIEQDPVTQKIALKFVPKSGIATRSDYSLVCVKELNLGTLLPGEAADGEEEVVDDASETRLPKPSPADIAAAEAFVRPLP